VREIDRILKPSGHLFLWTDKFHLREGIVTWLKKTYLAIVDMIVWNKGRIGMGYRTRRSSEYLLILQKTPLKTKEFDKLKTFQMSELKKGKSNISLKYYKNKYIIKVVYCF